MTPRRVPALLAVIVAGCLGGCGTGPAPLPFSLGVAHSDVTYCGSQSLDLYVPRPEARRPHPLAIYVHGGGMTSGDRSDLNPTFLQLLASSGYAVASVDYRLAPQAKFPAQIDDVTCAIRFLRARASVYDLSRQDVVAFGTSVGGELVALAALTGTRSLFDRGTYAGESSSLRAAVDMFGPADLTQLASGFSPSDLAQVFTDRQQVVEASPLHWVTSRAPPILIVQGADDVKVRPSQSIELYQRLRAAGAPAQLLEVQHMGHMFEQVGPSPLRPSLRQIGEQMVTFFNQQLG
jgi:acetyl esterase/lipase